MIKIEIEVKSEYEFFQNEILALKKEEAINIIKKIYNKTVDCKIQGKFIYFNIDCSHDNCKIQKALFFGLNNINIYTMEDYNNYKNHWVLYE